MRKSDSTKQNVHPCEKIVQPSFVELMFYITNVTRLRRLQLYTVTGEMTFLLAWDEINLEVKKVSKFRF